MENSIGVLMVIYAIIAFIIYHKIFFVLYSNVLYGLMGELIGSLFTGFILATLTLHFFWVADIILIIVGLIIILKASTNQSRIMIGIAFVVLIIIVSVMGVNFNKQVSSTEKSATITSGMVTSGSMSSNV